MEENYGFYTLKELPQLDSSMVESGVLSGGTLTEEVYRWKTRKQAEKLLCGLVIP